MSASSRADAELLEHELERRWVRLHEAGVAGADDRVEQTVEAEVREVRLEHVVGAGAVGVQRDEQAHVLHGVDDVEGVGVELHAEVPDVNPRRAPPLLGLRLGDLDRRARRARRG